MPMLVQDTIVALATPPGPGGRAIIRLSGPDTVRLVQTIFQSEAPLPPRGQFLEGTCLRLPATLLYFAGPRSYTGQDVAELHLPSCPPLVEQVIAALLQAGCRTAQPGEFTQRAFLAGKLDLTGAEAVHAIIDAQGTTELRQALSQLAGGIAQPLSLLREELLNLLADVEAGLDFADEDIQFVQQEELLLRLSRALAQVTLVGKQLESRSLTKTAYRVALVGRPNAGKSSLFNALAGARALVSEVPGTTRDYLVARIDLDRIQLELLDTPGWQTATDSIEAQAQTLGRAAQAEADLLLVCVEAGTAPTAEEAALLEQEHPPAERIATKSDLQTPQTGWLATSAVSGVGLNELRRLLTARARNRPPSPLAPSASRCQSHIQLCLEHLRRAHGIALEQDPPEILALELREALQQLGELVGAVYTDDLLDRIFSRFCIGK